MFEKQKMATFIPTVGSRVNRAIDPAAHNASMHTLFNGGRIAQWTEIELPPSLQPLADALKTLDLTVSFCAGASCPTLPRTHVGLLLSIEVHDVNCKRVHPAVNQKGG